MKFLVIGLGSMGKRRIRCLQALNKDKIGGFDPNPERCSESRAKYDIVTFDSLKAAVDNMKPNVFIISVPPDKHLEYMNYAVKNGIHFFVEASVLDEGFEDLKRELQTREIIAAPSATLMFHPAIQTIKEIIDSGELGKLSNILLHSGQYLPDWHTYEKVRDYYVSNPATGGGREIVPFELTWFTEVFGMPRRVCSNFRKTIEIEGAEYIDDTYNCLLDYGSFLANVTVDVVSRYATRRLTVNGSKKQLFWTWDKNCVSIFDPVKDSWEERQYEMKDSEDGYNANIGENMYVDEIRNFLDAIENKKKFINSMDKDHEVLKLLYKLERADNLSKYIEV